jgi:hypothetical protein
VTDFCDCAGCQERREQDSMPRWWISSEGEPPVNLDATKPTPTHQTTFEIVRTVANLVTVVLQIVILAHFLH